MAKNVSESILLSPKLSKILSITIYNLSRYNDSEEFLSESIYKLRQFLPEAEQKKFTELIKAFIFKTGGERTLEGPEV